MGRLVRLTAVLVAALALGPSLLLAQSGAQITGRVTADGGAALPGVTVFLTGMNIGTTTGEDGHYSLTVPADRISARPVTLAARRIG